MRKTKIICTIGPKTSNFETLQQLAKNGMNVARLNMSHGTHSWHSDVIKRIRTINKKTGNPVAILLDTKGPEIRTGDVSRDILLRKGDTLIFTSTTKHTPTPNPTNVARRLVKKIREPRPCCS